MIRRNIGTTRMVNKENGVVRSKTLGKGAAANIRPSSRPALADVKNKNDGVVKKTELMVKATKTGRAINQENNLARKKTAESTAGVQTPRLALADVKNTGSVISKNVEKPESEKSDVSTAVVPKPEPKCQLPSSESTTTSQIENSRRMEDYDDEPEYCPCPSQAVDYDSDELLPPDERLSSLGPTFWNRYLRGWGSFLNVDEDKENIYEFIADGPEIPFKVDDAKNVQRGLGDM